MTDKEIIIDGVDVSECNFFSKGITHNICENLKEADVECKYNSSCYFKQHKYKEQECEELKEKLIRISGEYKDTLSIVEDMAIFLGLERIDHFNIYQCYYKLKEMLNEYRQELKPFKDDYFKNLDTKTIAELAKKSMRLTTENRKLEDALDDIEYQVRELFLGVENKDRPYCGNILDIINKAKED